jgi:HSP20 family protein
VILRYLYERKRSPHGAVDAQDKKGGSPMLTRWFDVDPLVEATSLRSAMERLLEQAVVRPGSVLSSAQGTLTPPMDVFEQENRYVVRCYLPGIKLEDVDLSVRQGTLTLKGRWPDPIRSDDGGKPMTWLLQEFGTGQFTRTLSLPKAINGEAVEAHYEQGILTIILPVAAHEQPRTISIRQADANGTVESTGKKQSAISGSISK